MPIKLPFKASDRGDTIVEVIVVLAILGMATGICYATANRSLLDARQAQEAAIATELIQSQLESLRTIANNPQTIAAHTYPFDSSEPTFCMVNSGLTTAVKNPTAPPGLAGDLCKNGIYELTITYVPKLPAITGGTFTIQASWDDVEGQGTDTSTLVYNMYPLPPS